MANYIPALIIKRNNTVYISETGEVGKMDFVPSPGAGGRLDGDYWAVPIVDNGIFSGFNFTPANADAPSAPSPQAFRVFRLINMSGNDYWYVRGTSNGDAGASPAEAGYIQAAQAAECCTEGVALPTDIPAIAPCYEMCEFDADGKYFAVFGLPIPTGTSPNYYAYGYYQGAPLAALSASGYATPELLISAMNSNWSAVGTWSLVEGAVAKVTQANGTGTDSVCIQVITINPSA